MDNINPDVVTLNEIKTKNKGKINNFFKERGFDLLLRSSGGIAIAALKKFKIINVTSSSNPCILAGLINGLNIRIISAYGPQETVPKDERSDFFEELSTEVQKCAFSGNNPLITGDLNSKIEKREDQPITAISSNGEMLLDLVEEYALNVTNFNSKCAGFWTRNQKVNGKEVKSVLDYCITNANLEQKLETMIIDEEKLMSPFRVKRTKKVVKNKTEESKIDQVYSDHNAMLMTFSTSFKETKSETCKKRTGWRITEQGLKEFNEITSHSESENLAKINTYNRLRYEMGNIMNSCFQKRTFKNNSSNEHKITNHQFKEALRLFIPMLKKGSAEKKVAQEYIIHLKQLQLETVQQQRQHRLQSSMQDLKEGNAFSVDKFWKLRKKVLGSCEERTSIVSEEGVEMFNEESIINEYRNEFVKRLSHRSIHPSYAEYEEKTNKVLETLLCSQEDWQPEFTVDEVSKVLHGLKKGKAFPDEFPPEIFMNAGTHLVQGITRTLNNIKRTVKSPTEWLKMAIRTLFKNKGSRKVLKYHRGIFLTVILSKVMEKLLLLRSKENKKY